ncbi:hypothetical protein RFI_16871, partial [Reticulomyxa filosa]
MPEVETKDTHKSKGVRKAEDSVEDDNDNDNDNDDDDSDEDKDDRDIDEDEEKKNKVGHFLFCYKCEFRMIMLAMAILLCGVVAISGYISWNVLNMPLEATVKGVMKMGDKILGNSTSLIAGQSFFARERFLDIAYNMSLPINNSTILENFYNNYFVPTIVDPGLDGAFTMKKLSTDKLQVQGIMLENSALIICDGTLSLKNSTDELFCQQYNSSKKMVNVITQFNTACLNDVLLDMWRNGNHDSSDTKNNQRLYWFNDTKLKGINPSVWMAQLQYNSLKEQLVAVIVRSSRIDSKYQSLQLHLKAVVYWVSDDDYGDVFVSSQGFKDYNISLHGGNIDSSIALTSNGSSSGGIVTPHSDAVSKTVDELHKWRSNINYSMGYLYTHKEYYVYTQRVTFHSVSPMYFWCVVVYPMSEVNQSGNDALNVVIVLTCLGCIFAIALGFIGQAVPIIPSDERYRLHPFFTNIHRFTQVHDKEDASSSKLHNIKEQILDQIRGIKVNNPDDYAVSTNAAAADMSGGQDRTLKQSLGFKKIQLGKKQSNDVTLKGMGSIDLLDGTSNSKTRTASRAIQRRHSLGSLHPSELSKKKNEVLKNIEKNPRLNMLLDLNPPSHGDTTDTGAHVSVDVGADTDTNRDGHRNGDVEAADTGLAADDDNDNDHDHDHDNEDVDILRSSNHSSSKKKNKIKEPEMTITLSTKEKGWARLSKKNVNDMPARLVRARTVGTHSSKNVMMGLDSLSAEQARMQIISWRKEEQKKQVQSNIKTQLMRSIFNRGISNWQTNWGSIAGRVQTVLFISILLCVGLAYAGCRSLVSSAIDEMRQNFLSISTCIGELSMEYEYFKARLMLQNFNYTMNQEQLQTYWEGYNVLGMIIVNASANVQAGFASVNSSVLSVNSSMIDENNCLYWQELSGSSANNDNSNDNIIRDCSTHIAAQEAWSKPYSCFGGWSVCYLGIYKSAMEDKLYAGALLTFQYVSDVAFWNIWSTSGLPTLRKKNHTNLHISPQNSSGMLSLNFSVFALTNGHNNSRYSNTSEWYLIESTSQNLTTNTLSPYDDDSLYVTQGALSQDPAVSAVTQYLIQPSPNQIPEPNQLKFLKQIFAYPDIAAYVYKDTLDNIQNEYRKYEEWTKLDWIFVLSVSQDVFTGDHDQYAALAIICIGGALI